MASAFAHAAVGAALAPFAPRSVPVARAALVFAALAVAPDADIAGFFVGIDYGHALGHRGLSHSLPFALLAGMLAASCAFPRERLGSPAWWGLTTLASLAMASHGGLDALTDAGLGVGFWLPFDDTRHFFSFRPLATSPLSPVAFLSPRGAAILANEARWLGPGALLLFAVALATRRARRQAAP